MARKVSMNTLVSKSNILGFKCTWCNYIGTIQHIWAPGLESPESPKQAVLYFLKCYRSIINNHHALWKEGNQFSNHLHNPECERKKLILQFFPLGNTCWGTIQCRHSSITSSILPGGKNQYTTTCLRSGMERKRKRVGEDIKHVHAS